MNANKLTLNLLKTDFMIIGSKPKLKDIDETISITIVGEEIYRSPYVKSLGFVIDQNLDWQDHVQAVIKKTSSGLAILRYTKRYLPFQTLKSLYYTLIECHFRYGNVIWGNCGETFLTKLQKIQNRAARIITGSEYDTPAGPLIE